MSQRSTTPKPSKPLSSSPKRKQSPPRSPSQSPPWEASIQRNLSPESVPITRDNIRGPGARDFITNRNHNHYHHRAASSSRSYFALSALPPESPSPTERRWSGLQDDAESLSAEAVMRLFEIPVLPGHDRDLPVRPGTETRALSQTRSRSSSPLRSYSPPSRPSSASVSTVGMSLYDPLPKIPMPPKTNPVHRAKLLLGDSTPLHTPLHPKADETPPASQTLKEEAPGTLPRTTLAASGGQRARLKARKAEGFWRSS